MYIYSLYHLHVLPLSFCYWKGFGNVAEKKLDLEKGCVRQGTDIEQEKKIMSMKNSLRTVLFPLQCWMLDWIFRQNQIKFIDFSRNLVVLSEFSKKYVFAFFCTTAVLFDAHWSVRIFSAACLLLKNLGAQILPYYRISSSYTIQPPKSQRWMFF